MTGKEKHNIGVTFTLMGDAMERFRDACNRFPVDYEVAAKELLIALEMIGGIERQLVAAKRGEQGRPPPSASGR